MVRWWSMRGRVGRGVAGLGAILLVLACKPTASPEPQGDESAQSPQAVPVPAGATIQTALPSVGRVSMGVYDRGDRLVRVLLSGAACDTGALRVEWDGLDWRGQAVEPGEYTWKLVHNPGLRSRFALRLGSSVPDEPWQRWVGDHVPVHTMTRDETGITFISSFSEVPDMIVKFDPTITQRLASSQQWYDGNELQAAAAVGDAIVGLTRAGQLRRLNRDTLAIEATWPCLPTPPGQFNNPNDLDGHGNVLAVTDTHAQQVHFLDPHTGQRTASVDLPQPRRLTLDREGNTYVTSGDRSLYRITPDHRVTPVLTGLTDPQAITVDPDTGELFVWDAGSTSQILHLSNTGQELARFGAPGGRSHGPYQRNHFAGVVDLITDGQGHLLIAEHALPRRVAKLHLPSATIVDEWFGGHGYYNAVTFAPGHPHEAWLESHVNGLIQMAIDYDTHTWRVLATYQPTPELPGGGMAGSPYLQWFVRHHQQRTYLLCSNHDLYVIDEAHRVMRALRTVRPEQGSTVVWTDLNENQQRDPGEASPLTPEVAARLRPISHVDAQWNLLLQPGMSEPTAYFSLPSRGWAPENPAIPTWDYATITPGPTLPEPLRQNPDYGGLYRDAQGVIHQTRGAMRMPGDERHGDFWPAIELAVARALRWSPAGELLSITGRHLIRTDQAGQSTFAQPGACIGEARGLIAFADRAGNPPAQAFDRDTGLFVGNLMENRADDGLPDWVYNPWFRVDFAGGHLFELPDGSPIWVCPDFNSATVYRIEGMDQITRQSGRVTLQQPVAPAQRAGTGLTGTYYRNWRFNDPATQRLDAFFRYGPRNANDQGHQSSDWLKALNEAGLNPGNMSVVWEGSVEPPLTDDYQFTLYLTGSAKLFIDGQEVLDTRQSGQALSHGHGSSVQGSATWASTRSLRLDAGRRVPIRIQWQSTGLIREPYLGYEGPMFHLHWETPHADRLAIPTSALYPSVE